MNAIACAGSLRRLGDRAPTSRKRQADHDDGADQHADRDHSAFAVAHCITKGPPLVERRAPLTKGEVPAPPTRRHKWCDAYRRTTVGPVVRAFFTSADVSCDGRTRHRRRFDHDNLDLHEVMRSTKVPIYKLIQRPED